jgi:hypothetical protein
MDAQGFGLEDILGLVPLRIDQYRCYHAVGRTRRQRTAISLVPLRIDQYRCYRAVGRTRRQRTDRLNFTRESYTREGLIQNRCKAPGGYYYKTRPGHATQSQRWQQLQDKNDTPSNSNSKAPG